MAKKFESRLVSINYKKENINLSFFSPGSRDLQNQPQEENEKNDHQSLRNRVIKINKRLLKM